MPPALTYLDLARAWYSHLRHRADGLLAELFLQVDGADAARLTWTRLPGQRVLVVGFACLSDCWHHAPHLAPLLLALGELPHRDEVPVAQVVAVLDRLGWLDATPTEEPRK